MNCLGDESIKFFDIKVRSNLFRQYLLIELGASYLISVVSLLEKICGRFLSVSDNN